MGLSSAECYGVCRVSLSPNPLSGGHSFCTHSCHCGGVVRLQHPIAFPSPGLESPALLCCRLLWLFCFLLLLFCDKQVPTSPVASHGCPPLLSPPVDCATRHVEGRLLQPQLTLSGFVALQAAPETAGGSLGCRDMHCSQSPCLSVLLPGCLSAAPSPGLGRNGD